MASDRQDSNAPSGDLGSRVATRLARDLFSGHLPPGSLLPREVELADAFGVSRASVRSGLQTLAALGIVRRQSGQGTVVTDPRDWNLLDPLVTGWMVDHADPGQGFLREIFEFRTATEPFIAALAAHRATARDLAAMEAAFEGMAHEVAAADRDGRAVDVEAFTVHDVDFHAAVYRATGNLVWAQLSHILRPAITLVVRQSNATADELRDSLGRHRHLMDQIRLRRPDAAFDAAEAVMRRTGHDLGLDRPPEERDLVALWRERLGSHPSRTPAAGDETREDQPGSRGGNP